MSGSELMDEIKKQSGGCWKPSPGSIYPLLAWLQDEGYIREVPTEEGGRKRYALTDRGKKFFEEHLKIKKEFRRRLKFFAPPFFGPMWLDLHSGGTGELQEAMKKLVIALWGLRARLEEKYPEQAVADVKDVLNRAAKEIEEIINRKLG